MKKLALVSSICAVALLTGCNKEPAEVKQPEKKSTELTTDKQKVSYIVGQNIGQSMQREGFKVDLSAMHAGLEEAIAGKDSRFNDQESQELMMAYQQVMMAEKEAEAAVEGEKQKAQGIAFLAENAKKEGVVQTESGLQYKELVAGEGAVPTAEDVVVVNYSGTLLDGTEFDSSYKRGQPAEFKVGNLIAGWVEALQLMNEGDQWELYIPSDLAYGPGGTPSIPPNATLIFKMELISIKKAEVKETPAAE